jgi:hypothetical protein
MSNARSHLSRAAAAVLLCASLGACVVSAYGPDEYYGGAVAVAPPPLRVETYGPAPGAGYLWIGGYWDWAGGRHEWVRGHWEAQRPGYRWVPHHWQHRHDGWHLARGHWDRR